MKVLCHDCGEMVAPFLTHECIGWDGKPEKSILPWWVDTMKDQGNGKLETRTREPLHVPPWWFWPVVVLAIVAGLVYLW